MTFDFRVAALEEFLGVNPPLTPPRRGSQESGVAWELLQYHFLVRKSYFFAKGTSPVKYFYRPYYS